MARGGVARSNMLLLLRRRNFNTNEEMKLMHGSRSWSCRRSAYKVGAESGVSKLLGSEGDANAKSSSGKAVVDSSPPPSSSSSSSYSCCWVPHPRTGIYFPVGHEWVMKDVPEDAATFAQTCWFRNADAIATTVDNHNPNPNPNQDAPYRHHHASTLVKLN